MCPAATAPIRAHHLADHTSPAFHVPFYLAIPREGTNIKKGSHSMKASGQKEPSDSSLLKQVHMSKFASTLLSGVKYCWLLLLEHHPYMVLAGPHPGPQPFLMDRSFIHFDFASLSKQLQNLPELNLVPTPIFSITQVTNTPPWTVLYSSFFL